MTTKLLNDYFNYQKEYEQKFGKNKTIVLIQIGSFYEAYQTNRYNQTNECEILGPNLQILQEILNIKLTNKSNSNSKELNIDKLVHMMGFPCYKLSKYLQILMNNNYNVIVISQISESPNPMREITGIYSSGTYIENIEQNDANNLISIYIEFIYDMKNKTNLLSIGISLIDLSTGSLIVYEIEPKLYDEKYSICEAQKFINSFSFKEIIVTIQCLISINYPSNSNLINQDDILQKNIQDLLIDLDLYDKNYILFNINQHSSTLPQNYKNYQKIKFQEQLLYNIYNIIDPLIEFQLDDKQSLLCSLTLLILYINDHNNKILKDIQKPQIYINDKYLIYGNNTLQQLNILTFDHNNNFNTFKTKQNIKSLFDVINKTNTPMGQRYLKQQLIQPIINVQQLNIRYSDIQYLIENDRYKIIEKYLQKIGDIERLNRKMILNTLDYSNLYQWNSYMEQINELLNQSDIYLFQNMNQNTYDEIINKTLLTINYFKDKFDFDEIQKCMEQEDEYIYYIFNKNNKKNDEYKQIYKLYSQIQNEKNFVNLFVEQLNKQIYNNQKNMNDCISSSNKISCPQQCIKIQNNTKDGIYFQTTKKRYQILLDEIKKNKIIQLQIQLDENNIETIILKLNDFETKFNKDTCKIFIQQISNRSNKINEYKINFTKLVKQQFNKILTEYIQQYQQYLFDITRYIEYIDFIKSGASIAVQQKYCQPIILNNQNNQSYIDIKQIRHPIVEKINVNIFFKAFDIQLGINNHQGILLYGLNSAGKSTLQKSIGINIILAQIGYFVAAEKFVYYPYNNILVRISTNDNLFKNQSSFMIELQDLQAIIKRSGQNTLVIADELCKGTEIKSSLIIILSMIKILLKNQSTFISATHLHELTKNDQLKEYINLQIYHIHLTVDKNKKQIIYDRQLQKGQGDEFYGLLFAQITLDDQQFNLITNDIKNKMENNQLSGYKKSKYNSSLSVQRCYICKYKKINEYDKELETHHINWQKDCDKKGFINIDNYKHLKKNHLSNLVILCHKCHDLIDNGSLILNQWKQVNNKYVLDYQWKQLNYFKKKN